jgi:hypothetical protein
LGVQVARVGEGRRCSLAPVQIFLIIYSWLQITPLNAVADILSGLIASMRHVTTLGDCMEGEKEGTIKLHCQPKFKPLA